MVQFSAPQRLELAGRRQSHWVTFEKGRPLKILAPMVLVFCSVFWSSPVLASGCPEDCAEWFDGCNQCVCTEGNLGACSLRLCSENKAPRCIKKKSSVKKQTPPRECVAGCKQWFDGCNACTCFENGKMACTRTYCATKKPPRCLDPEDKSPPKNKGQDPPVPAPRPTP